MDDSTKESLQVWDSLASGWDKTRAAINTMEQPVTARLHEAMGVHAGDTILELCAGPGEVGIQLAEKHRDARVLVTDFAPGMVEAAQREAQRRGLDNVECRVVDAQDINLPDASVDGVIARYGLMLIPDIPKAFAEIRRVLRPGRSLAYTTWAPPDTNPWMMVFGATMMQRGHFQPPEGGAFMPLGSEEDNVATAKAAGFSDVHAELVDYTMEFPSFDGYWNVQSEVAGPLTVALKRLPPDEREAIRAQVEEYAAPFRDGERLAFPSRRILVVAS